MHLRILTYNIHKGIGGVDRRYNLERTCETIADCAPDVAFLQEVDDGVPRSRMHRQVDLLAQQLGFEHAAYQPNVKLRRGQYGNAILSRFPLSDVADVELTVPLKKRRRALIACCTASHGRMHRRLWVVNMHLGLAGYERQMQIRRLLKNSPFAEPDGLPLIAGGDMNDVWNTLGRRLLEPAGFRPAGRRVKTFPALLPVRSLDYLYYRGPVAMHHCYAPRKEIARQASDHRPLVADFELLD